MNYKTIRRIDEIVKRINTHPEYSSQIHREADLVLHREAAKHSFSLEQIGEINGKRQSEQAERAALRHIREGWEYLQEYGLSTGTIGKLGYIVEPKENHTAFFRTSNLVQFGPFIAPSSGTVSYHVDNLVGRLQVETIHPITRAAEAHIELVRIHPYVDGNGRVARLVQNYCLRQWGYPAAVIPSSERELYIKLLENSLKDRQDMKSNFWSPSRSETLLQEYFASKVLTSVERLEDELKKRRRHTVIVNKIVDRRGVNSVSDMIRSHAKAHGRGVAVQSDRTINSKRGARFNVVGDVSVEDLEKVMGRCKQKYGFTYSIHPRTD